MAGKEGSKYITAGAGRKIGWRGYMVEVKPDGSVVQDPQVAVDSFVRRISVKGGLAVGSPLVLAYDIQGEQPQEGTCNVGVINRISSRPPRELVRLRRDYARHEKEFLANKPEGWDEKMAEIKARIEQRGRVVYPEDKKYTFG